MSPQPLKGKRLSDIKFKPRLFGGITINARTVVAPLVAFTMATLLFVYARSSIQAAKRNAKNHRVADGGQISWYNESQRRHGAILKSDEQGSLAESDTETRGKSGGLDRSSPRISQEEEKLWAQKIRRRDADG